MRGFTRRMTSDRIQKQVGIRQYGFIAEAQHRKPALHQVRVSGGVFHLAQSMHAAIQLDHELEFITAEIGDPAPDAGLTPKLMVLEPSPTQDAPHRRFGRRHSRSQSSRLVHSPLIRLAPRATFSHEGRKKNRDTPA